MFSREGFTLDVVAGAVRNWILTPTTTLPLALGLTWEPLFARLAQRSSRDRAATIRSRVYWLAAASLALALNDHLNKQSANNWVVDSRWNWDDEIVVVTGGSSGIGASICQKLVARNARTRIVVLDYVPLSWTPPPGARLHFYECDLSDAYAIKLVCDRVKAELGHPTVLFNNAGLARGSTVMEGTSNDVQLTIKTNLIAPFLLVREFLPEMVRRDHGHILNAGSLSSVVSAPTIVDYSASKAGLTALHEVCFFLHRRALYSDTVIAQYSCLSSRCSLFHRACNWSSRACIKPLGCVLRWEYSASSTRLFSPARRMNPISWPRC